MFYLLLTSCQLVMPGFIAGCDFLDPMEPQALLSADHAFLLRNNPS